LSAISAAPAVFTATCWSSTKNRRDRTGRFSTSTAAPSSWRRYRRTDPERALVGRLLAVSFTVDDIDGAHRDLLARGVPFPAPPEVQPWGGVLAFPRDPDGNILTLVGRRSL
jgi:hypothetical protein